VDLRALSSRLDRGARSGVGIAVFDRGGFVVDGGRGARDEPAPLLARLAFPENWRVLLVFDSDASGVHGEEEKTAFQSMPPAPPERAAEACRRTLMQILPALIEEDLETFSEGVRAIQDGMAAQFAPWQGGSAFRSARVREALAWVASEGVYGTGQSSWGPTGFAFVTRAQGEYLLERARHRFEGAAGLSFDLVKGCNHGASVTVADAATQQ
jgi:beta-RFAP synthase